jgi:gamma-glutamylcyclotransferase (GGCT)/AIG2-like uncharacterized protein YtfP
MTDLPLSDVPRLIAAANAAREHATHAAVPSDAERQLEARFRVSRALAVYGTLAPGRSNHHVVAPLGGEWTPGVVEGDLAPSGWGAVLGYPALHPRAGGPVVAVQVLRSAALPDAWPRVDAFEGPEYRRILVPVWSTGAADGRRLLTVANLYAAVAHASSEPAR